MRLRQWRRRSIQSRLVMALGLLVAVSLLAGILAWAGLYRTEQALLRDNAAALSDLRKVLGLAERSARLAAEAPALARASNDGLALREADALKSGVAELHALAASLPLSVRANASVPTEVPSIVRLAERLDGILDHLLPVIAEQIAAGRELARRRDALAELSQNPDAGLSPAAARAWQRALANVVKATHAETQSAVEELSARFEEDARLVLAERQAGNAAVALDQARAVFALRSTQVSASNRVQVFLAAVERAAAHLTASIRNLADAVELSAIRRAQATTASLHDGKLGLMAGGALSLLGAVLVAWLLMRGVASNIEGATLALTRLADGDDGAEPPGLGRADEIGDLARAFLLFKAQAIERNELTGQLRQAQKMEAIGQLTGGIAHDFNNLLAAISCNLQLIGDQADQGSQTKTRALRALDAVGHGDQMVQRLLAFARRQPLAPQVVDINRLVEDLADLLGPGFGSDLVLELRLDPSIPLARVDPGQLEQAILNLVINARDAIEGRGRVCIETQAVPPSSGGRMTRIVVRDSGPGMPPEVAQRAFEPFFTTKPFGTGSGLGLSTVYGFVRQSGGEIAIESLPGEGTAIVMDFPRAAPRLAIEAAPAVLSGPRRSEPAVRRGRILIVEDDPRVREATLDMIASFGHEAQAVASAEAALQSMADRPFDVLFTDIVLPLGMSGLDLARRAREIEPSLGILCCSGFPDDSRDAAHRTRRWSGPVLAKPYANDALKAHLDALLSERARHAA